MNPNQPTKSIKTLFCGPPPASAGDPAVRGGDGGGDGGGHRRRPRRPLRRRQVLRRTRVGLRGREAVDLVFDVSSNVFPVTLSDQCGRSCSTYDADSSALIDQRF